MSNLATQHSIRLNSVQFQTFSITTDYHLNVGGTIIVRWPEHVATCLCCLQITTVKTMQVLEQRQWIHDGHYFSLSEWIDQW